MAWFTRKDAGIHTLTEEKKEVPDGLWYKCPECKKVMHTKEHKENAYTCIQCSYQSRIGSKEYFEILFDENKFEEYDINMFSKDMLNFEDTKKYSDRLELSRKKTSLFDAVRTASGEMDHHKIIIACMDFEFIGGSMGSVVGEKVARSIDRAREKKTPLIIISKSGGARMMESAFSLMQLAKTSAKLALLKEEKVPYISILTDPTTGGVTASFAMLGDFNIAEPGALIGFAGPRVVRETIGKDLPKGFQSAEFLLEHGFVDFIVPRNEMKQKISLLLRMLS
ncbi:MAG: acetyl-CoA carboxylase subunit beta [Bacteroidetes bacterium RIFCSPLOWO2_02_FULL_36_8]|nr:MAG: acetyl-CoA carboxylase subunit beta [Bacteroidetes bacterium RIFCSPLOWO2_02_FULL_36_8]OFY69156.1 MAG: acetyl-CoA carboxylase subunit beta [Bacteroidetes bacterium RIFCSPLOWO2_12_FULL_37_12]